MDNEEVEYIYQAHDTNSPCWYHTKTEAELQRTHTGEDKLMIASQCFPYIY